MRTCSACKNRSSDEKCSNKALAGLIFCGVHSRNKNPRIWSKIHGIDNKIIKLQKRWKGYIVRKRLSLAGPGVLKRSLCTNKEDSITLEPITEIDPFDYFGFEENGKIYGVNFCSFADAMRRKCINPFTRQPFSMEARKRFREIYSYRLRNNLTLLYQENQLKTIDAITEHKWLHLCQIIEENGFFNIHPNIFMGLGRNQLIVFLTLILTDLKVWAAEHKKESTRRFQYIFSTRNALKRIESNNSYMYCSHHVASVLCIILYDCVDPYNVCFIIMSALYRL